MTGANVEITLQRAHEKYPDIAPRVISESGPQFIAKGFPVKGPAPDGKEYTRLLGMTHVRTSLGRSHQIKGRTRRNLL